MKGEIAAADILATIAENEALKAALDEARRKEAHWFDVALTRLGTISSLSFRVSVLENELAKRPGATRP